MSKAKHFPVFDEKDNASISLGQCQQNKNIKNIVKFFVSILRYLLKKDFFRTYSSITYLHWIRQEKNLPNIQLRIFATVLCCFETKIRSVSESKPVRHSEYCTVLHAKLDVYLRLDSRPTEQINDTGHYINSHISRALKKTLVIRSVAV